MEALLAQVGYWAVLIDTFLEGETILIAAGYAGHRGWLDFRPVVGLAFVGSALGDHLYFWIGRRRGMAFLESRPTLQARIASAQRLLHRHSDLVILASGVSVVRFLVLNVVGAAIWAICFGGLGFVLGSTFQASFDRFERHELDVLLALIVLAAVWAGVRALRARVDAQRASARRRRTWGERARRSSAHWMTTWSACDMQTHAAVRSTQTSCMQNVAPIRPVLFAIEMPWVRGGQVQASAPSAGSTCSEQPPQAEHARLPPIGTPPGKHTP